MPLYDLREATEAILGVLALPCQPPFLSHLGPIGRGLAHLGRL
jgi:hypothetical protein